MDLLIEIFVRDISQVCTKGYFCTKTLLHEDTFEWAENIYFIIIIIWVYCAKMDFGIKTLALKH